MAEAKRERIAVRTTAVLAQAKERGVQPGNPKLADVRQKSAQGNAA